MGNDINLDKEAHIKGTSDSMSIEQLKKFFIK